MRLWLQSFHVYCSWAGRHHTVHVLYAAVNTRAEQPVVCACAGDLLVNGLQLGNVWIGVQPALGVEGDPMRLLFERDLTPHPQAGTFETR